MTAALNSTRWRVTLAAQSAVPEMVKARGFHIADRCLVFDVNDAPIRAFARGAWADVAPAAPDHLAEEPA